MAYRNIYNLLYQLLVINIQVSRYYLPYNSPTLPNVY